MVKDEIKKKTKQKKQKKKKNTITMNSVLWVWLNKCFVNKMSYIFHDLE
jgi:hypothetical protein